MTGQPRASKIAVIHKPHEHEHVRSRVGSLGSRSPRPHRGARRQGARGVRGAGRPPRRSAIASSSRSARTRTTSCDDFRRSCAAKYRTAIRPPSSIARSRCSSRRSRERRSARRRRRGLSVPGRIGAGRGTLPTSRSAWPGGGRAGSAASSRRTDIGARSVPSWSSTTSRRSLWVARPRPTTSGYGVAGTINTRRSGCSGRGTAEATWRRRKSIDAVNT